jgi:Lysylphosphatidylglycerol synthase TM region
VVRGVIGTARSAPGWSRETRQRIVQTLLAATGLALVAYLVHGAGPAKVLRVLEQAAWWLPAIFALEIAQIASDILALRLLLGREAARVSAATWVRSSAVAYAMMILVPAGRASGEVTRGALLAKSVGAAWAATAAAQLQASYLFANGLLSTASCIAVGSWIGFRSPLALVLAGNATLMAVLSTSILAVLRGARAGRWIEKIRQRFIKSTAASPPLEPEARRRIPWRAAAVCTMSRGAQVLQYGVILAAVGGVPSVRSSFIAHGIHLVGSTAGDMLPNQLGAVDSAYQAFAAAIGFAGQPARALSIAFVAHATQLLCAATCILIAVLTRRGASPREEEPASTRADAHS